MKRKFEDEYEAQAKLIYSIIVAGKSADFADKVIRRFIDELRKRCAPACTLPFQMMNSLPEDKIWECAVSARTGNYKKLARACSELAFRVFGGNPRLDIWTCKPADLEVVHGIGPKTSRFFIMWIRPEEKYAALDVHVLRWLGKQYVGVPKSTPSGKIYERWEKVFLFHAERMGKTARQLDKEIWSAGAGRTQTTALPD